MKQLCFAIFLVFNTVYLPQIVFAQNPSMPQEQKAIPDWIAVARGIVLPQGGIMRLAAQREGLIDQVFVDEGDQVVAGQELARLDNKAQDIQVAIAKAELEQALTRVELAQIRADAAVAERERVAPLGKADALPRRQIDEAIRNARTAEIEVLLAQQASKLTEQRLKIQQAELEARIVRAPIDGVIVRRAARPGDRTSTSTVTQMFLLAPNGPRVLKAQLDEQFVGLVHRGQKAEIVRERDDGTRLTGEIIYVAPVFKSLVASASDQAMRSNDSRTVEISVRLDGPQEEIDRLVLGQQLIARISR